MRGVGLASASLRPSQPLAAEALPKFDSGIATIFFIVYSRQKASFRDYIQ